MNEPYFDRNDAGRHIAARHLDRIRDMIADTETLSGPDLITYAGHWGTQADLAAASGLTPVTVTSVKHGHARMTRSTRASIRWGLVRLIAQI